MLVPSEDSSMDNERLASAPRTEGALAAQAASFCPEIVGFIVIPVFLAPESGAEGNGSPPADRAKYALFALNSCI
jgi:hypothetical protein